MTKTSSFKDVSWYPSYKTSSLRPDGQPVDILHDFYIPVLKLAVRYDRVAGFFRSSSLAIASQGFSAFTAANGRMRLVVGADLEPHDVAAILEGNRIRLEKRLLQELEGWQSWPEDVSRGVRLLSWMVAKGHLDVKVAFRVHGKTGRPIPIDSTEDGYVHEKWAVFTDKEGNRIYISGSLNESRTALALNAENIDVHCEWWNGLERKRVEEAQRDFEAVWRDRSPYLRVMELPEAVRKRLIRFSEGLSVPLEVDGTTAFRPEVEPPSAMERLRFAIIKDGPFLPGGRFVGMATAPVEPWPHQEVVARRLIETWPFSWLLCDEVGLGKTIEAGLAIRSLVLSGLVKRVLIAPPASLTRQWQREMASKFLLSFARALTGPGSRHEYIFPEEKTVESQGLYSPPLSIVSTGLLAHKGREIELTAALAFDIALVDEAHYARRKNPAARDTRRVKPRFGRLYRVIRDELRNRSRCLLLATATPMQLDWIEAYDLIRLTNRIGAFRDDPTLVWGYYEILGRLGRKDELQRLEWAFLRKVLKSIEYHDPFLKEYFDKAVIDGRIRAPSRQFIERGRIPRGRDRDNMKRLIFSAAPLSRVMLRHTRALLEIYKERGRLRAGLAKRVILPTPRIVFTKEEKRAYERLEEFCSGLARQIGRGKGGRKSQMSLRFLLSLLRLRFASSLYAIGETVKRRLERVEKTLSFQTDWDSPDFDGFSDEYFDEEGFDKKVLESFLKGRSKSDLEWEKRNLKGLLESISSISKRPSKIQTLLDILENRKTPKGRIKQTVIFTRFYDTLTDIVSQLTRIDTSILIGTYSGKGGQYTDPLTGSLKNCFRDEVKHRFLRDEIDVLVCTDAAAEGLNLQTADLLINFDLPWNPMKVEQRIGRIDRIGQKHQEIYVLNLFYTGSVEEIVYGRLLQRLVQAGQVVGSQQVSLLPIYEEEFEKLASGKLTENELERIAKKRIEKEKEQRSTLEIPATELYEIYMRMGKKDRKEALPVTLSGIWDVLCTSDYLRRLGCEVSRDKKILVVKGIDGVLDGSILTADRDIMEKGMPGIEKTIRFASYGDPVFDAILNHIEGFDLPDCAKRISVPVKGFGKEVVCLAVAVRNKEGIKIEAIVSLSDLLNVEIAEDHRLTDSEISSVKEMLKERVQEEFMPLYSVEQIEKANIRAAKAHHVLSLVAGFALLNDLDTEDNEGFWQAIKRLDQRIERESILSLHNLWTGPLRPFSKDFLFDVRIPELGEWASVKGPRLLGQSALDSCCRLADSIHKKRAEVVIGEVLNKMEREIEKLTQCRVSMLT